MKTPFITSILFAVCVLAFFGCERQQKSQPKDKMADVKKIIQTLENCPLWITLAKSDLVNRENLTKTYQTLSIYDNETIRDALVKIESDKSPKAFLGKNAKTFPFLRVIFDVPSGYRPREESQYSKQGGWGSPLQNEQVDVLWPYELDKNSNLILIGGGNNNFHYATSPYSPVEDFDFMLKFYKRRIFR